MPKCSGLARKRRSAELSEVNYRSARERFESDCPCIFGLISSTGSFPRELIERHPRRGSDAIHLASAVTLGGALEEEVTFVAADTCLLQAAKGEGLQTLNPEG